MKKFILCFSLLTLAIAGIATLFHRGKAHDSRELANAAANIVRNDHSQVSPQPQIPLQRAPKLSVTPIADRHPAPAPAKQAALRAFAQLPLDFEANRGQAPANFDYVAHGPGYVLGLSPGVATLSVQRVTKHASPNFTPENFGIDPAEQIVSSPLELRLVGANANAAASGVGEQPGRSNYFIGNDPSKWHTQVPHFSRVKMAGVYPGVNLDFYGNPQQLEYDFLVSPGANPKNIRLQIQGANRIHLDHSGNAILRTPAGDVQLKRPVSYQQVAGIRKEVESKFKLVAGRELQFQLGPYDRSQPLVIDPVLIAAVSLGGTNGNTPNEIADVELDSAGNVYLAGDTCATDFPSTVGPFQNSNINQLAKSCTTAVVIKFDPTLSTMAFSDFIGGTSVNTAWYMAVDAAGNTFVTGGTNSTDFPLVNNLGKTTPLTPCSISKNNNFNCPDAFVLKLSPDGSHILFSELMGGSQASAGHGLELNPVTHEVIVVGGTNSSDFTPAPTTLQTTFSGTNCVTVAIPCFETFLYGLDPNTGAVKYGTFLGGTKNNFAPGFTVDSSGAIYLAGSTQPPFASALGPVTTTVAPASGATAGGTDIFAMKLSVSPQNALTVNYITVIQGEADDAATSLAVDSSGNAYLTGFTASQHLAVTPGVFQSTNQNVNGDDCAFAVALKPFTPSACGSIFVAKLSSTGTLSFLTYLGGTGPDVAGAISLDSHGNIWLGGNTSSVSGFPMSADAYPFVGTVGTFFMTPFLAEMSNDGTKVPFATPVGSLFGEVTAVNVDSHDNIFVAGFAANVPSTPGVFPPNPQDFQPAFVQEWNAGPQPVLQLSSTFVSFPDTPMGALSPSQTVTVTNTGAGAMELSLQLQLQQGVFPGVQPSDFLETDNCATILAPAASCTVTIAFSPGQPSIVCLEQQNCVAGSRTAQILVNTNAPRPLNSPSTISLAGNTGNGAIFSASPNPIIFPAQAAGTSSAPMDIQIENSGDVAMTFSTISLIGAGPFTLAVTSPDFKTCLTPTNPSTFCGVSVTFNPSAGSGFGASLSAQLVFTDSAGGSPQTIPIFGTVAGAAALNISPQSIAIGPVAISTSGPGTSKNFTLSNPTTTPVTTTLTITGDTTDFTALDSNCTGASTFTVPANGSCFVQVHFNPIVGPSGLRTATIGITSPQVTGIPSVSVTAEAVNNTDPALTFFTVPSPLNFGTIPVGQTSNNSSSFLSISNTAPIPCAGGGFSCGGPLTVTAITPGNSDYSLGVPQGAAYCTTPPFTIPPGNNGCTIPLLFSPTAIGARNTSLVITSNDPQGPVSIPLSGAGVAIGIAQTSPQAVIFGSSQIGAVSPAQIVTLQNVGRGILGASTVSASTNFTVAANNCNTPVPAGGTCTVAVTFTPPSAGPFSGTLTFTNDAAYGGKQAVSLSGTGASGALLLVSPTALLFGNQPSGTISLPQTVTLTSTGNVPVTFPSGAIRGSTDFIFTLSNCGISLAPGASCTFGVEYNPSPFAPSFEPGTVSITDNAPGNPQFVSLTGNSGTTGSTPTTTTLIASANPVAAGQPVTFTAKVSPQSGTRIPTGPILFLDGLNTIASVFVDVTGQATFTTTSLTAGSHSITAAYTGGFQFLPATSAPVSEVITGGSLGITSTAVVSSANPSITGQSVTFTATVTPNSGGTPTGTVTFFDNNGTTQLGTGTLNGQAKATFATSTLTQGTHSITAQYGGDANFIGTTSPVLTQIVNNGVPVLTSLAPTSALVGATVNPLTITGTGFVTGTTVFFNNTANAGTVTNGGTTVTANIPGTELATAGTVQVQVLNPASGGVTSNSLPFTINNPAPTIASLSPSTVVAGSTGFTLMVNGTGYVANSVVNFNGVAKVTTFVNTTQLSIQLLAADVATAGAPSVTVTNPTPGGGTSSAATFTISSSSNPVPVLTSISPNTAPVGSAITPLTATGTGFVTGSTLIFNGTSHAGTVTNNGTTLTANILATEIAATGTVAVSISNPTPGGGASNSVNFVINNFSVTGPTGAVTITAGQLANFSLNFATQGGALPTTVNFSASGLPTGSTVSFNPASLPVGSASGATTMTIATTARTATPPFVRNFRKINPLTLLWITLFALIAFVADRVTRANQKGLRLRGSVALVALICLLIGGCTSTVLVSAGGTPAGTSAITVTATSGTVSRTTTVTLTVQ